MIAAGCAAAVLLAGIIVAACARALARTADQIQSEIN